MGGFGGPFLENIGSALVERENRNLAENQRQRKQLWDLHSTIASDPTATQETRIRALQNLATVATLKPHAKIPKELTDVSLYMTPPAGYGQEAPQAPPSSFETGSELVPGFQMPPNQPGAELTGAGGMHGQSLPEPPPGFAGPQYNMTSTPTGEPLIGTSPFNAPPPPKYSAFYSPQEMAQIQGANQQEQYAARVRGEYGVRAEMADKYLPKNATPEQRAAFIAGRAPMIARLQQKTFIDPKTGRQFTFGYDNLTNQYFDQNDNPADITGLQPATSGNDANTAFELFRQAGLSAGKTPKQISDDWNTTQSTMTNMMSVVQPDGSIELVPIQRGTVRTRGGVEAPTTPPAKVTGEGTTVGGKALAPVTKAFETYNAAIERYNVMEDAYPKALKGDQQAMLNLLANHIGMTMGLQRGARITQAMYDEALQSSPWLAKFEARFDGNGDFSLNPADYRNGVVLTEDQMRQMIDLAQVRRDQDELAYRRVQEEAGRGFKPPAKPKAGGAGAGGGKKTVTMAPPKNSGATGTFEVDPSEVTHYESLGATRVTK